MKVQIEKVFAMPASADVSWKFLQDIAAVGACMPGAKITERLDDTHYKGTVSVKVGPATMSFRGDIEVRELDAAMTGSIPRSGSRMERLFFVLAPLSATRHRVAREKPDHAIAVGKARQIGREILEPRAARRQVAELVKLN